MKFSTKQALLLSFLAFFSVQAALAKKHHPKEETPESANTDTTQPQATAGRHHHKPKKHHGHKHKHKHGHKGHHHGRHHQSVDPQVAQSASNPPADAPKNLIALPSQTLLTDTQPQMLSTQDLQAPVQEGPVFVPNTETGFGPAVGTHEYLAPATSSHGTEGDRAHHHFDHDHSHHDHEGAEHNEHDDHHHERHHGHFAHHDAHHTGHDEHSHMDASAAQISIASLRKLLTLTVAPKNGAIDLGNNPVPFSQIADQCRAYQTAPNAIVISAATPGSRLAVHDDRFVRYPTTLLRNIVKKEHDGGDEFIEFDFIPVPQFANTTNVFKGHIFIGQHHYTFEVSSESDAKLPYVDGSIILEALKARGFIAENPALKAGNVSLNTNLKAYTIEAAQKAAAEAAKENAGPGAERHAPDRIVGYVKSATDRAALGTPAKEYSTSGTYAGITCDVSLDNAGRIEIYPHSHAIEELSEVRYKNDQHGPGVLFYLTLNEKHATPRYCWLNASDWSDTNEAGIADSTGVSSAALQDCANILRAIFNQPK